jgi:hypothetical protein
MNSLQQLIFDSGGKMSLVCWKILKRLWECGDTSCKASGLGDDQTISGMYNIRTLSMVINDKRTYIIIAIENE